tara:strand:+ start:92 stop:499 length:408 start_codon:yes stop_codon:yes gene_type:complete
MEIKFNLSQLKKASKELKMHINQNVVLISGEMGVGKTTLIKELLLLYGVTDNVTSPTFSIINEYLIDNDEVIYHMDLYRVKDTAELENIGFFEYVKSRRTCLIEWGETIEELIDSEYNKFTLIEKNNLRVLKKNR